MIGTLYGDITWCASEECPKASFCGRHRALVPPDNIFSQADFYAHEGDGCGWYFPIPVKVKKVEYDGE